LGDDFEASTIEDFGNAVTENDMSSSKEMQNISEVLLEDSTDVDTTKMRPEKKGPNEETVPVKKLPSNFIGNNDQSQSSSFKVPINLIGNYGKSQSSTNKSLSNLIESYDKFHSSSYKAPAKFVGNYYQYQWPNYYIQTLSQEDRQTEDEKRTKDVAENFGNFETGSDGTKPDIGVIFIS